MITINNDKVQASYFDEEFSEKRETSSQEIDTYLRYQYLRNKSVIACEQNESLRFLRETLVAKRFTNDISPTFNEA